MSKLFQVNKNFEEDTKMSKEIQKFTNEEFSWEIRSILIDGEPWLVGKDVAIALGYTNPAKALADHVPNKYKLNNESLSSLGQRGGWLINEAGLYKLIMRSKLPSAEKFSDWCCEEVLPSIRKTGKYEVNQQVKNEQSYPVADILRDIRDTKSVMIELGVSEGIAMAKAVSLVEKYNQFDLSEIKSLAPSTTDETGCLNPTQIGEKVGISNRRVNKLLRDLGYQYKENDEWFLTELGKKYGEKFPYENNGHSGYQIRWNEEVVDKIKECL